MIDITNPESPYRVGSAPISGYASGVAIAGDNVFVAGSISGLQIIPLNCEGTTPVFGTPRRIGPIYITAYPNPFNPQTTLAFEIPGQRDVTISVFDLSGCLVRSLIVGETYTPGRHEMVWNGRDEKGRQVASGTYFYRLETGSYSETKSMTLLK